MTQVAKSTQGRNGFDNPTKIADKLPISQRSLIRGLILALLLLPMMQTMFVGNVSAQDGVVSICNADDFDSEGPLATSVQGILRVLLIAAALGGTIAIAIGFAADSVPFLDAERSSYKKQGLLYGWGFVVILLVLKLAQQVIGLDLACFFPI